MAHAQSGRLDNYRHVIIAIVSQSEDTTRCLTVSVKFETLSISSQVIERCCRFFLVYNTAWHVVMGIGYIWGYILSFQFGVLNGNEGAE